MTRIRQMVLARRKARGEDEEAGFTLIELLVVLLIIAILLAIAIPTFLGARTSAENRAAQTTTRNALTAIQSAYTGKSSYPAASVITSSAASTPAGFSWIIGASTSPNTVSVVVGGAGQSAVLGVYSKAGTCYYIAEAMNNNSSIVGSSNLVPSAGTWYGFAPQPTATSGCTAGLVGSGTSATLTPAPAANGSTTAGAWSTTAW